MIKTDSRLAELEEARESDRLEYEARMASCQVKFEERSLFIIVLNYVLPFVYPFRVPSVFGYLYARPR